MIRSSDAGVALINVLVVLGLAATLVYAMLTLADLSIERSQRFSEAGQALALIRAGEQSAIAALRRDMAEAPEADHAREPWATTNQLEVEIAGGTFALQIGDATGLFNLNALVSGDLRGIETFRAIAEALELPTPVVLRIAASLELDGPLFSLDDLGPRAGVERQDIARLGELATALPGAGQVNINSAPEPLLAVLLRNPVQARRLVARRERAGFLTEQELETLGVLLPPGIGFTSDLFRAQISVRIGDTHQAMESILMRKTGGNGDEVMVIDRRNKMAAAFPPPPPS